MKNIAAAALGLVAVACVVGIVVLAAGGDAIPDALVAVGSAAVGALGGVVIPRGTRG